MFHSANCVTRTGGSPANSTRTDTRLRAACANGGTPASGAGGRRGNRHSEVEHPDAWAHRYLDEQDRGYATAVRQMSTGAGGAANEKGAPASGCPLVWVCLPVRGVDLRLDVNDPRVVAEVGRDVDRRGHSDRRVDGRGGLGGGGEAEDGSCEPASGDGGKPELVHCDAFFFLSSAVFEPWREVAVRRLCRPVDDGSFAPT